MTPTQDQANIKDKVAMPTSLTPGGGSSAAVGYDYGGYLLDVYYPSSFSTTTRDKMVIAFYTIYPQLVARFKPVNTSKITYVIDSAYAGPNPAFANGRSITYWATWMNNNPNDIDIITHETMHIVQEMAKYDPVWLVEGIADYVRYSYGYSNAQQGWALPNYNASQSYTEGYGTAARFLVWLEQNYDANIVDKLYLAIRKGTYLESTIWITITGKSLKDLWSLYGTKPALNGDLTNSTVLVPYTENANGASSAEGSLKVIDNNTATKYYASKFVAGMWLQLKLAVNLPQAATSYKITSANDYATRDPKSWRLLGYDGTNWITLDTKTNQTFTARAQTKTFTFSNTTAYPQYLLIVDANNGATDFQIAEWRVFK